MRRSTLLYSSTSTSPGLAVVLTLVCHLASLTMVYAAADHWVLTTLSTLIIARLDPIINPAGISGHAHSVLGASNFHRKCPFAFRDFLQCPMLIYPPASLLPTTFHTAENMNSISDQQKAACSSAIIGADKSNYWSPTLFYRYENNTYAPMLSASRIYYYTKSADVKPFPPGLRMITGSSMSRDLTGIATQGVKISCDHGDQSAWMPNATSYPGGCSAISLGIFFPSCGLASGQLDSSDHFSHMAWPVEEVNGETCPESHPIKYPTIFYEANYYTSDAQPWRNDDNLLVLSNGDCTGNSYHADFVNGVSTFPPRPKPVLIAMSKWDPDTLSDTISQCGLGKGPGDDLQNCAPLAKTMNQTASWECRYQKQLPDEDVGLYRPIASLPGCNKLWTAKDGLTKPACASTKTPTLVNPDVFFENLKYRIHVPIVLPNATDDLSDFVPSLGDTGSSKLLPWGSDGTDIEDEMVGTWEKIVSAWGGIFSPATSTKATSTSSKSPSSTKAATTSASMSAATKATRSSSKSSSTTRAVTTSASKSTAAKAIATTSKKSTSTSKHTSTKPASSVIGGNALAQAAATSTSAPKCKKKKRGLVERSMQSHRERRSRRAILG
ncbi:hypothetical protein P7C73_g4788, partial [Tremellales sp. Uapishka_1]